MLHILMTSPNWRKHLGGNHRVVGSVSGLAIRGCGAAGSDPSGKSSKCPKSFRVAHLMKQKASEHGEDKDYGVWH